MQGKQVKRTGFSKVIPQKSSEIKVTDDFFFKLSLNILYQALFQKKKKETQNKNDRSPFS